jgi:PAS domain S-box-containing protein
MDHSLDFVEFLGAEGLIQRVSGAIKNVGGYDPEQLVGSHYQDLIHPEDCGRAADAFASVLRGEAPEPVMLRYRQILVGLRMTMESSRAPQAISPSGNGVDTWIAQVRTAIDHLHRLTVSLRAPVVGERGLESELRVHLNGLSLRQDQTVELDCDADLGPLAPELELAVFRIVQEALANAIKHSGAKRLRVSLKKKHRALSVTIRDDGIGFDVAVTRAHALKAGSIGLLSMRERAALAGGRLEVHSSAGHGTEVHASFHDIRQTNSSNLPRAPIGRRSAK